MIHINEYYITNSKATIIIVHGIAEHSGRYETIAKRLNDSGYDVVSYDHLGHGKSSGKRGKIKSFKDHIEVLHNIVLSQKERSNNEIYLMGHSMGGGVVNLYAVTYNDVAGIISIAAATQTPSNAKVLKYTGFWYLRWVRINSKIFDNDLAKDPNVLIKSKQDDLMLKYFYVSLIGEMFVKGVKYLHKNINNFKAPVLYLHGTGDKIVDYRASEIMYNKINVIDKEIILYDGEYHEMLNDYNSEKVILDILDWLSRHVNK